MLSLLVTGPDGTDNIISLVKQITWSGSLQQGARILSFEIAAPPYGPDISIPDLPPGRAVSLFQDEAELFSGYLISRSRTTGSAVMTIRCYDRGFYLLKNQGVYQFRAMTPDAITRRICADFGLEAGSLAAPGTVVSRNFIGVTLYRIIMTAYTLAAQENDKAYQIRFRGNKLDVVEIEKNEKTLILEGGVNLQSASATDSIEKTITQAVIYNAENKSVRTIRNEELISLYGIIQNAIRQPDGEDVSAKAQKLLRDNGLSQTITVENLGNAACVTGNTVVLKEPHTGLYGLFWITSDKHVWKDGQYYNQLSLSYKRIMDEQEAGSLPNKTGSATADKTAGKVHASLEAYYIYKDATNQKFNSGRNEVQ
jgi:hypothetical protein